MRLAENLLRVWAVGLLLMGATLVAGAQMPKYTYETAVINPNNSITGGWNVDSGGGRFNGTGLKLEDLVRFAYGKMFGEEVTGIPATLKDKRWDVRAKADAETTEAIHKLKPADSDRADQAMMMALLEERFKLKSHIVTRDGTVLLLVPTKSGLKLTQVVKDVDSPEGPKNEDGSPKGSLSIHNGVLIGENAPMEVLASALEGQVQRQVQDRTGLKGRYDFTLKWRADDGGKAAGLDDSPPSLETALQEQLGLKLESGRGKVEAIVVDSAEMPSEN